MSEEYDVVVIGSGAGGLAAAVSAAQGGARVLVAEKADTCGGATAWSGGWMWTPRHRFAREAGVNESIEEPLTYLRNRLGEHFDEKRVRTYLETAPEMVDFFQEKTALEFVPGAGVADIHEHTPGSATGHRQVAPKPVRLTALGKDVARLLRRQMYETSFLGMGIMAGEDLQAFLHSTRSVKAFGHCAARVSRHFGDLAIYQRGQSLVNGTALVGRLLRSALDAGVSIRVNTRANELITDATGRIIGVDLEGPEGAYRVKAEQAVVLATGGFSHNAQMRKQHFYGYPNAEEHWSLPPAGSGTGDGIKLAESVGGHLKQGMASAAAFCPVSLVPLPKGRTGVFPHILDRAKPGTIGVLSNGKRFVNEANGYHDFCLGLLENLPAGDEPHAWLIADANYMRYYPLGFAKPAPVPTFPYVQSGYLKKADSLASLARKCGINAVELEKTVAEFNRYARNGEDPEFHRGRTVFNRNSGDPDNPWPNPSLAPLEKGPYYAVKVLPGSFGTFAGLETDERSRVLQENGEPVPGLYAVGCDQANVLGGHYPSGGINIGPAMTFGYLAGQDIITRTK
ncbi:FAD-dependent oxidoreductase [Micrococcoides hystricis]|uniref:FAD-dependent oxidoreductase n=1 Tax=Micrococcoides hystricis TaxID=1572761 RepID=A0ABV6PEJ3_9MICC